MADRILALVTDAFGGKGGIARYNRDLLAAWSRSATVRVVPRGGDAAVKGLSENLAQDEPVSGRFVYGGKAVFTALTFKPTIVFCGHLFMAPLALAVARLFRARMILQVHGIDAWTNPGTIRRLAAERSDLILSVSRFTRARLLDWAAMEPERVAVLPNTVDERFTPGDRQAARARFGFRDAPVLLTVGRLDGRERYKGHDSIISALPRLLVNHPGLVYAVAGEGDDFGRLQDLAVSSGVGGVVRFLGAVPDEALPDLFRAADLFVLPSTGEGFGIVFLEAMACGTPALGLGKAGALDALQDGRLGNVCSEGDLPAVIDQLLTGLHDNQSERARLSMALSCSVRDAFGVEPFRDRAASVLKLVAS